MAAKIKLDEEKVKTPFMCKDKDEFYKSMLIMSDTIPEMDKGAQGQAIVDTFKMMAHDYLALVLSGKLEPYEFTTVDNKLYDEMRETFEQGLRACSLALGMSDVPTKEGENGKIEIDWDSVETDPSKLTVERD